MTKVKICGLSTKEAVNQAVESGADYIGFVFATSQREVSLEQARKLRAGVPERVQIVGVFVSPTVEELENAISKVDLDLVQVHGEWEEAFSSQISRPVIRAYNLERMTDLRESQADFLLFDAPVAGSGQTFDWEKLQTSALNKPFFIAGGLNVDNVQEAIDIFSPDAVDVSSGVETDGKKDVKKIAEFIERVKNGI